MGYQEEFSDDGDTTSGMTIFRLAEQTNMSHFLHYLIKHQKKKFCWL